MELKFQVQIKIQKPVEEVFQAVYDPKKLSGYFTNGGASAPLEGGTTVEWAFDDTPGQEKFSFPVEVLESVTNKKIVFKWQGTKEKMNTVEINFESTGDNETLVKISESGWESNQEDLTRSYGNCMGWSQMLSALKAYTEYGIDLRKGAYTGMYKPEDKAKSA
ncbi:MAG: ATPase [Acidobacteria bacterium]|nr:MAG: ATPase [Acidobacteriota bacterium]